MCLLTPLCSLSTLTDHINSWLGLNLLWINFVVPDEYFCIETNQCNSSTTTSWTGNFLNSKVFLYQSFFYLHVSPSSCLQYVPLLKSSSCCSGPKQLIYGGFWIQILLSLIVCRITFPTFPYVGRSPTLSSCSWTGSLVHTPNWSSKPRSFITFCGLTWGS